MVVLLSVGFTVWAFAASSLGTAAALTGALGAVVLGLAVFGRVRRGTARRGVPAIVGAQLVYLALWTLGGLLWAGPPRELPRFASPVQLSLEELQGRWTRGDGRVYEVRGERFCPENISARGEELRKISLPEMPLDPCLTLVRGLDGRLSIYVGDEVYLLSAYRRWGREVLTARWFDGLTFSRPTPNR